MERSSQRRKNIPGEQGSWRQEFSLRSISVEELSRLEVNSYEDRKLVLGFCDKEVIVDFGKCYFRSNRKQLSKPEGISELRKCYFTMKLFYLKKILGHWDLVLYCCLRYTRECVFKNPV